MVPEAYRQRFRYYWKLGKQTHVEFVKEKENLFNRWCHSKSINKDYEKLKQLIIIEEFKNQISLDVRTYIEEHNIDEFYKAAVLADEYATIHNQKYLQRSPPRRKKFFNKREPLPSPSPSLPNETANSQKSETKQSLFYTRVKAVSIKIKDPNVTTVVE